MKSVRRGDVVLSIAGHDEGSYFLVLDAVDENKQYLLLADGKTRSVIKPKKKKIKHCRLMSRKDLEIELFADGKIPTDAQIRKYLRLFLSEEAY